MGDQVNLPQRSNTVRTTTTTNTALSDDEIIPESDMSATTNILLERLQAWKHMCGYLENYMTALHKAEKSQSKEFEKVLKTVSEPLKEAHHFHSGKDGVAGLFDNLRANTQGLVNLHLETEKSLKTIVLPTLERLHQEIKAKAKELRQGAAKGTKQVEKARSNTQKHIELLGQYAAAFDSSRAKLESAHDPYILWRGTNHRMNKQITEENNHLQDMLQVQNSFSQFETHILETVQGALNQFFQCMGSQADRQRAMYAEIVGAAQQIPPDFEWIDFFMRNDSSLLNPNTPPRTMSNVSFPNQDHHATKPRIEGTLERKSRAIVKGYSAGYYAVSPAGYLHGFKDNDDYRHEPTPDITLYLPECTVGNADGLKFTIKGKDVSGTKVGQAFHTNSELSFKAHTKNEAEKWLAVLTSAVNPSGPVSSPTSPSVSRQASGAHGIPPLSSAHDSASAGATPTSPTSTSQQEEGVISPQNDGVVAGAAKSEKDKS
ncbi:hypothetical protein AJ79_05107 [Helicocarpus griseus UAMH5409]|uniref:PH domain-containing protein n=1 Tax=Helicocarpus griseus UAMH5409 TaxID=1447875 RepID=A0A2B7XQ18_9EURO|nr:hypothetical protein AJ79_05107 [Helicocarpus griseus UAMH5409]